MRILVTNDDGIHAPGLVAAEKIARALTDDVWMVAPETEQSGASHSLTLTMPLRLREIESEAFCSVRHADRLRDDGLHPSDEGRAADFGSVRRQSRFEHGRRRDLLRHHSRSDGRLRARHSVHRASRSPMVWTEGADVQWACAEAHGPAIDPKAGRDRLARGRADQHQFPRLRRPTK